MKLTFLGANRQVTGSRYCLEAGGRRIMIDCGLFQEREFLARNWEPCPVPASDFDALLLTHAHIDHSGLIPKFVREGFHNPIYATHASVELAEVMLRDAAHIQTEDAVYKRKRHQREHRRSRFPEEPLYAVQDVEKALPLFRGVKYHELVQVNDAISVVFHDAGHILGSSMLELTVKENGAERRIIFSGDIGQWHKPFVRDPSLFAQADYVVMESTYGDKDHLDAGDIETRLAGVINETAKRGGNVVIPTFAVERAQELMYYISRLVHADRIPDIPVFLDSPMAVDVTGIFRRYEDCFDEQTRQLMESDEPPLRFPGLRLVRSTEDSKAINRILTPCVIMSASGMCNAGRIKHHLRQNVSRHESTILFVGYQGRGTLGRQILDGNKHVRIHGQVHRVDAHIEQLHGLSAHADRSALLKWLCNLKQPPRRVFLTHGEEDVSLAFAKLVQEQKLWQVSVPRYQSEFALD